MLSLWHEQYIRFASNCKFFPHFSSSLFVEKCCNIYQTTRKPAIMRASIYIKMLSFFFKQHNHWLWMLLCAFKENDLLVLLSQIFVQKHHLLCTAQLCVILLPLLYQFTFFKGYDMSVLHFHLVCTTQDFKLNCFLCFNPCGLLVFFNQSFPRKPLQQACV